MIEQLEQIYGLIWPYLLILFVIWVSLKITTTPGEVPRHELHL